jgi:site-specific DNA recombinase
VHSTVREVLHRELYRGVTVWNQTRKRDRWGKQDQRPRPQAEWLRVPTPALQVVSTDLWTRAHAQLTTRRHQYSQIGKPVDGEASARGRIRRDTDAAHLLTGLARCAQCGGGMSVLKRQHGGQMVPLYGCLSHWKRGPSICANRLLGRSDTVDAEVLATLQDDIMRPRVIEEAIRIAMAELAPARQTVNRRRLAAELTAVRAQCERLADGIALGGPLDALVARLQERQARRAVLEGELAAERSLASHTSPPALEQRLRAKLAD